jgi:Uma2 family endonuclease
LLPNGARRSPDASWYDRARWEEAVRKTSHVFPPFAPEFVVEVRSRYDRMPELRAKMREYIDSGVLLGWLIDWQTRTVEIYRPNREPEILNNPATVAGEGPVEGFVLTLERIF